MYITYKTHTQRPFSVVATIAWDILWREVSFELQLWDINLQLVTLLLFNLWHNVHWSSFLNCSWPKSKERLTEASTSVFSGACCKWNILIPLAFPLKDTAISWDLSVAFLWPLKDSWDSNCATRLKRWTKREKLMIGNLPSTGAYRACGNKQFTCSF